LDWRAKVELCEEIRREYEFGVGTIAGVARKAGVHRRMVREAVASALPKPRKKTERPRLKLQAAIPFMDEILQSDRQAPLAPHEPWPVDISDGNRAGTFYALCSVLEGDRRDRVHGELRETMKEAEGEIIRERGREKFPQARPRLISDHGPQFIARDFKEFIRMCGMTPGRTSPFYPQSNGKIERWHPSLKGECLRPGVPGSAEESRSWVAAYGDHYNRVRLHSAIGDVAPGDKLEGRAEAIGARRDQKLEEARKPRQLRRPPAERNPSLEPQTIAGEAPAAGLN
jgi:putative transposase